MITVLMVVVFRSFKLGLAAMIPNVFPVLVAGGIMGFARIPLEFVTITVAPMIMGLAVDDTIHMVFHLKRDMTRSGNFGESLNHTFKNVGSAITETTLILCLTFLVFTVSRVNSIVNMGIITCSGILAAYAADVLVTPVIIRWLSPSDPS
jgi:predicted RND superfamily exporter protein